MTSHKIMEVLLVEDNSNDAELAIRALKKQNLANHVAHVKDGAAALDYMFAEGIYADRNVLDLPKIILLDLKLPKVNGLEVLAKLRADPRTHQVPIVIMTSSKEEKDMVKGYELGVNSYIVKPVEFSTFSESVASLGCYWLLLNEPPPVQKSIDSNPPSFPSINSS